MESGCCKKSFSKWLWDIIVLILLLTYFLFLSRFRVIAGDEGFYVMAARLVGEGKLPYLDFFYPQMPLMPFLYGAWLSLFGNGWIEVRALSAIFAALTGLFLYWHITSSMGRSFGLFSIILYLTSELVISEFVIVKTYSSTSFFVFASYLLLSRRGPVTASVALAAGALLGLGINVRLTMLGLLPIFIMPILLGAEVVGKRGKLVVMFSTGVVLASALAILLFYADNQAFWFNNLGYHLERTNSSLPELWAKRWQVLFTIIGLESSARYDGFSLAFLFWGNLIYGVFCAARLRLPDLSFFIAAVIIIITVLPSPCYLQYVCVAVPFLIVSTLLLLRSCSFIAGCKLYFRSVIACLAVGFMVQSVYFAYSNFVRYCLTGFGVIGVSIDTVDRWRISTMKEVGAIIDSHIEQNDLVIAPLPVHIFATKARPLPGLENNFALSHGRKNRTDRWLIKRFHLVSPEMVSDAISAGRAKLLVVIRAKRARAINEAVAKSGYALVADINGIMIYRRPTGDFFSGSNHLN